MFKKRDASRKEGLPAIFNLLTKLLQLIEAPRPYTNHKLSASLVKITTLTQGRH